MTVDVGVLAGEDPVDVGVASRTQQVVDAAAVGVGAVVLVSPGRSKLEALGRLVDQGELRPVIGAVLPLADVAQAHTLVEGGSAGGRPRGKITVAVADPSGHHRKSSGCLDGPASRWTHGRKARVRHRYEDLAAAHPAETWIRRIPPKDIRWQPLSR
ncbi:zinc-binding dehydrogenase [Amycolatopsis sp. cmx-11-12]|uniref:zinc-binding dehydrogenase n=1 Tax=Amycolatopsis sp. cmx-11-12 TaxID=2785795 RepID=UPI0039175952